MAITAIKRYSAGRGYRSTDPIYNYLTSDQIIKLSKIKRISDSRQTALGLNKSLRISTKPTPQKSAIISNPQPPLTGKFKRPPSQTALSLNKSLKQGVMGKFKRPKGQTGIGWSGQSSISKTTVA